MALPGFTDRELAALPGDTGTAMRLRAMGRSDQDIKREIGVYIYRLAYLEEAARRLITTHGLAELERVRAAELDALALDVLPPRVRNCLVRNGYRSAANVRAAGDPELLLLRGFGRTFLEAARRHFPYEGAA